MARSGVVRCMASVLLSTCVALLLGGEACASSVRITLSGTRPTAITPQTIANIQEAPSLVKALRPASEDNLGLTAAEALTRVWEELASAGQQATDNRINDQEDVDSLSILDEADYAATAVDVAEPTLEQFSDDAAPESAEEELEETYAAPQPTYSPMGDDVADEDAAAQLWSRAQRALSWLMGCTHGAALMPSQPLLVGSAQLQVTGSSEALPAAIGGPSALLQRLTMTRPAKITMLLGSVVPGQSAGLLQSWGQAAGTDLAQQEPLMMQKDGIIRPQKLANLLQSLSSAQAAAGREPAEGAATVPPQVLMTQMQGLEQPQSFAAIIQQLPWNTFGQQLKGEPSALPLQTELLEAEVMAPTARAAIPGQNGATVVLANAQPFGQDMMQQVQAGAAQSEQLASTGAVDGSFPSPEAVGEAGAELAQKLGIPLEQALDQVVSTVLQQRAGGSPEWAVETQGGEDHESLTELDTLPAAKDRQQADAAVRTEVTAVPPQAGPDVREGYLQRVAGFLDELLGRVARALNPKTEQTAEEIPEDVKGPVVLATASGRGPAEVTAYRAEQSRIVEGVSADRYFVEPSLVADDVPLQAAVPDQAPAPVTANAHNNAAAAPAPVPAPEADQESAQLFVVTAPGPAITAPAAANSPRKGNANTHNNSS